MEGAPRIQPAKFPLKDGRTLHLRAPTAADAPACIAFLRHVGGETDYLLCDENGIEGLTLEKEQAYLQSSLGDPLIGMYLGFVGDTLVTVFDVRPFGRARIRHNGVLSLAVRKPFWGLGVGTVAMRTMLDFAKNAGYRNLTLDVRDDNARAIALYRSFGFADSGLHRRFLCIRGEYYDQRMMDLCF